MWVQIIAGQLQKCNNLHVWIIACDFGLVIGSFKRGYMQKDISWIIWKMKLIFRGVFKNIG